MEENSTKEHNSKKMVYIPLIGAGILGLALALFFGLKGFNGSGTKNRDNTLKLIENYKARGEYDRALSLLEKLLLENPDDPDLNGVLDQIILQKKNDPEYAKNGSSSGSVTYNNNYYQNNTVPGLSDGYAGIPEGLTFDSQSGVWRNEDGSVSDYAGSPQIGGTQSYNGTITVDTSSFEEGLASVMKDSLSSMQDALERSNLQVAQNQKAVQDLLKLQAENEEKSRKAEAKRLEAEEKRLEAEKERLAQEKEQAEQRKAEEEQRKKEEEKRKVAEAELAQKNAAVKKQIEEVNEKVQLGKTALATGNIAKAMEYFEEAQEMLPIGDGEPAFSASKNSEIAQALYDAANNENDSAAKAKLKAQAVAMAEMAVKQNPKDAASHFIIASDAYDRKDYKKALDEYSKAVQLDPNNNIYFYNLGKTQYVLKKYSEAVSSFSSSCKIDPKFHLARYNLGLTYLKLGKDKEALDSFRRAIEIEPRHENSNLEQARLLFKKKDYTGSVASYRKVLEINNSKTVAWQELGNVYYQTKKYADSENAYRHALTLMQDGVDKTLTQYNLSTVLFEEDKKKDALAFAKNAYNAKDYLSKNADKAVVVYNYALLLDQTGNVDDAIPIYMEVLTLNPDHDKTKINLGVMYMNLEPPEVDLALNLFAQVYSKDSKNFEATNNMGSAYLEKQDYKKAVEFYQKALILDSKNNGVRLNLARAFTKDADYSNAKTTLQEVIRSDDKAYDAYIEVAKVCMQLGQNDEAEGYLYMLQDKNPSFRKDEVDSLLAGLLQ